MPDADAKNPVNSSRVKSVQFWKTFIQIAIFKYYYL